MQNFTFNIPTVVHFGKGQISKLGEEIASRASRVLVVYGGGSVKRNGVYDGAVEQMKAHGIEWVELSGVEPNPRIITVRKGVELCRANKLDGVLEVGKKADIIAIDLNRPHLCPNVDPLALMTYSAQGSDVVMTMVDGRILYENGEFLTLDTDRILHDARACVARLYR